MKKFNFIIGIILFLIINLVFSFYASAFLLQLFDKRNGISWVFYVFMYAFLASSFIFIWHKYIFSDKNERVFASENSMKWKILKIIKFFLKIIFIGIVFFFASLVLYLLLNFDCWFRSCENVSSGVIFWIFGIIFLFYCFYFCETTFRKKNSEKISQNNLSEIEK